MKVVYATNFVFVFWLLVATPYWKISHHVKSHTPWECHSNCYFIIENAYKYIIGKLNQTLSWFNKVTHKHNSKKFVTISNKLECTRKKNYLLPNNTSPPSLTYS